METKEIEVRFLEVDLVNIKDILISIGAQDLGEKKLDEVIFYDKGLVWRNDGRYIRLRRVNGKTVVTYKENKAQTIDSALEIEFEIGDYERAQALFEKMGFTAFRVQQKKRHTFKFKNVALDFDTWPRIPTYLEIEGESERELKDIAKMIGLDWKNAIFDDARSIIEKKYNIPVSTMKCFTFDRFE
jgi:adenylate cyclase, class 2